MVTWKWEINVCETWRENCKPFPDRCEDKKKIKAINWECDPAKTTGPNNNNFKKS